MTRRFEIPPDVAVVDGGTLGLALLPLLQDYENAIFVDAVRKGPAPPGTYIRIEGEDVLPAVRQHLSVHQIGVADLLDAARLTGACPSRLVLVGLVPENLEVGVELSEPLRRELPRLIARVVREIANFGFPLRTADRPVSGRQAVESPEFLQKRSF